MQQISDGAIPENHPIARRPSPSSGRHSLDSPEPRRNQGKEQAMSTLPSESGTRGQ